MRSDDHQNQRTYHGPEDSGLLCRFIQPAARRQRTIQKIIRTTIVTYKMNIGGPSWNMEHGWARVVIGFSAIHYGLTGDE
jgi:hypothetical protein